MDTYVHVTEDSLSKAVKQFEANNIKMVSSKIVPPKVPNGVEMA